MSYIINISKVIFNKIHSILLINEKISKILNTCSCFFFSSKTHEDRKKGIKVCLYGLDVGMAMKREVLISKSENRLDYRGLENDSVGNLVLHLEGKKLTDFCGLSFLS